MNALIIIFYRIAAFFTRVPRKTREKQRKIRLEKISDMATLDNTYINRQSELSYIPFGSGDIGANGCGPISVYNALLSLKNHEDELHLTANQSEGDDNIVNNNGTGVVSFSSIIHELEDRGAALYGKFGTSPSNIRKYLANRGFTTYTCMSKNPDRLNTFANDFDTFITIIFNDAKSLNKGLHFICSEKKQTDNDTYFLTHNPEKMGSSLYEALNNCSSYEIRHIYTIGIKK